MTYFDPDDQPLPDDGIEIDHDQEARIDAGDGLDPAEAFPTPPEYIGTPWPPGNGDPGSKMSPPDPGSGAGVRASQEDTARTGSRDDPTSSSEEADAGGLPDFFHTCQRCGRTVFAGNTSGFCADCFALTHLEEENRAAVLRYPWTLDRFTYEADSMPAWREATRARLDLERLLHGNTAPTFSADGGVVYDDREPDLELTPAERIAEHTGRIEYLEPST